MGTKWVEFYLISAHGLHHSTSLWKRHWYAVGWIDHNSKYCTRVDDSGSANPVWRTKFAIPVDDDSVPNIQDLALNVEVYSIDPIFFTEKLHGSATIGLKEFLDKQVKNSEVSKPMQEQVGSYQLRKKKSSKPRGFIDVLIRISEEMKEPNSHTGSKEGIVLLDHGDNTQLTAEGGLRQSYPQKPPQASTCHQPEDHEQTNVPDYHSVPFITTISVGEPSYQPPRTRTPPSPPPPSNIGYIPTFLPRNDGLPPTFTDIPPPRTAPGQRVPPPGVALELSAGALAAGAVIFGDDFLSGFDVPAGLGDATVNMETDYYYPP